MLHDPMRTHSRATVVGVCIAALGLLGFLIWGILSPQAEGADQGRHRHRQAVRPGLRADRRSRTRQLVPVFNLASARLLLMAQQQKAQEEQRRRQAGQPAAGARTAGRRADRGRRQRAARHPEGPQGRHRRRAGPAAERRPAHRPAVDGLRPVHPRPGLPDPAKDDKVETTVIAGVDELGPELKPDRVAAGARAGRRDLPGLPHPGHGEPAEHQRGAREGRPGTARGRVPRSTSADVEPRNITTGMLNAIPEKAALVSPGIARPGLGLRHRPRRRDLRRSARCSRSSAPATSPVLRGAEGRHRGGQAVHRRPDPVLRQPWRATIPAVNPDKMTGPAADTGRHRRRDLPGAGDRGAEAGELPGRLPGLELRRRGRQRRGAHVGAHRQRVPGIPLNPKGEPQSVDDLHPERGRRAHRPLLHAARPRRGRPPGDVEGGLHHAARSR